MALNTRTAAEEAVHADTEAQLAAGGDPFGDDEPIVAASIEDQAAAAAAELAAANGTTGDPDDVDDPADAGVTAAAPEAAAAAADDPTKTQPTAAQLAEIADDTPAPVVERVIAPPKFRVASADALEADRLALHTESATALQQMMDGDLAPAEYAKINSRVIDKLGQLSVQAALAEANAQTSAQVEASALTTLMNQSKTSGALDYFTDVKAQKQFDIALNMLQDDPDNAGKSFSDLIADAHASVLAVRGISKPAATPAAAAAPTPAAPRVPEAGPITLRGLPNASTPATGGTIGDALGRLKGADYQAAFSKLTPAQKAAMVDD